MLLAPPDPSEIRFAISEIATRNGGSIRGADLRMLGLTSRRIDHLVAIGFLHRVRRDHFLVGHRSPSIAGDRFSKVAQAGDDAFLSSTAAIHEWGFLPWTPRIVDVVVPKARRPIPGVRIRLRPQLIRLGGTRVGDLRILTPEFAVLAASDHLDGSSIRRILREGRHQKLLSIARLERVARSSLHGVRRFREAFELWQNGDNGHWSQYEKRVDAFLPDEVLHGSIANAHIVVGGETLSVDRVWMDLGICAEYDGPPHDQPDQQRIDRIRSAALRADRWDQHRVHWKEFDRDPHAAVEPLVRAVHAARARNPNERHV